MSLESFAKGLFDFTLYVLGPIPSELGNLSALVTMILSYNILAGIVRPGNISLIVFVDM